MLPTNIDGAQIPQPLNTTPTEKSFVDLLGKACVGGGDINQLQAQVPSNPTDVLNSKCFLHDAIHHGQDEIALFLIENGADPEVKDAHGVSAYDLAKLSTRRETLLPKMLNIAVGRHVNEAIDPTILGEAKKLQTYFENLQNATLSNNETFKKRFDIQKSKIIDLLEDPDTNEKEIVRLASATIDKDGTTFFHYLAATDDSELVEDLLECGVDPNQTNTSGLTPFHFAAALGTTTFKTFLQHEGDIHHKGANGVTPLSLIAVREGRDPLKLQFMEVLLAVVSLASLTSQFFGDSKISTVLNVAPPLVMFVDSFIRLGCEDKLIRAIPLSLFWFGFESLAKIILPPNDREMAALRTMVYMVPTAISTVCVAAKTLGDMKTAWSYAQLNPLKALKSMTVRTINLAKIVSTSLNAFGALHRAYQEMPSKNEEPLRQRQTPESKAVEVVLPDGVDKTNCEKVGPKRYLHQAYRARAIQLHPDTRHQSSGEEMVELNNAFDKLKQSYNLLC